MMNFSLIEIVEKQTKLSYDKVISSFLDSNVFDITSFSDENFNEEGKFKLEIRPPAFLIDFTTSRVEGSIYSQEGLTNIRLKFRPSWIIIGFIIVWSILLVPMFIMFDYENTSRTLQFIGFSIIWASIPFVIGRLKVYRDRKRLERWMRNKIGTLPNNSQPSY